MVRSKNYETSPTEAQPVVTSIPNPIIDDTTRTAEQEQ